MPVFTTLSKNAIALDPSVITDVLLAQTLGLSDRGQVREGFFADLAVFEPAGFRATATTFEPNQLAQGMRHVVVNGIVTLKDGQLTGARAGEVIRRRHT